MGIAKSVTWNFADQEQGEEDENVTCEVYNRYNVKKKTLDMVLDTMNKMKKNRIESMLYFEEEFPNIIACNKHFNEKYGENALFDDGKITCPEGCNMRKFDGNHLKY